MREARVFVQTLSALGIAAFLAACSNSGTSGSVTPSGVAPDSQTRLAQRAAEPDATVEYAYVVNFDSNNVSAYTIATSGALGAVAGSPFMTGTNPQGVAVDPKDKFAYVANNGSANVSAYKINATSGALTAVAGSPFAAGTGPWGVSVDPTGKFAYASNFYSENASAYTINAQSGALTQVAGSPFPTGTAPIGVATCRRVGSTCKPPPL